MAGFLAQVPETCQAAFGPIKPLAVVASLWICYAGRPRNGSCTGAPSGSKCRSRRLWVSIVNPCRCAVAAISRV